MNKEKSHFVYGYKKHNKSPRSEKNPHFFTHTFLTERRDIELLDYSKKKYTASLLSCPTVCTNISNR